MSGAPELECGCHRGAATPTFPKGSFGGEDRCLRSAAVDGLGNAGGFKLMSEAIGEVDFAALQGQADNLAEKGNQLPNLMGMADGFRAKRATTLRRVDRVECKTMEVR